MNRLRETAAIHIATLSYASRLQQDVREHSNVNNSKNVNNIKNSYEKIFYEKSLEIQYINVI